MTQSPDMPAPRIHQVWPRPETVSRSGPTPPDQLNPDEITTDEITTDEITSAYRVARPRPADRPWVALTMIASLDGATEIDGNSRQLGNRNDSNVLKTMRSVSDVIMVGAASAVADHYGPPSKQGQRIGVVTRSIDVDLGAQLFTSGAGFLVTTDEADVRTPAGQDPIDVVRCGPGAIDFSVALSKISELIGDVRVVSLEGGPTLNALMLHAGLVDELNITTAPLIVGGRSSRLVANTHEIRQRFDLAHQLVDDEGYVFSRWVIQRPN